MIVSPASLVLAGLALALIWPITRVFARARWVSRAPHLAIALWVSCGLAIGCCLLGTVLSLGTPGHSRSGGLLDLARTAPGVSVVHQLRPRGCCAVIGATFLLIWMTGRLIHTFVTVSRQRRRHLATLQLIGSQDAENDVLVVDHDHALAYCVPGIVHSTIVVTRGCLDLADPRELQAVLAHERAHADGRHDLLLTAFVAWQRTFPFLRSTGTAVSAVSALTEMLADDVATRKVGADSTVSAIRRLHSGLPGPAGSPGGSLDPPTLRRVRRLSRPLERSPRGQ